ncbi:MAG: hypothetical protein ABJO09_17250 [Hyphomicrobiales bacterium]
MKFPVLGLMIAVVLGQYGLLAGSNTLATAFTKQEQQIVTANLSNGLFCRSDRFSTWSCPHG